MITHYTSQRGIALVLVLWALALLTSMAAAVVMTTRTDLALAHNRVEEAELRALSEAAIVMVAFRFHSPAQEDRWFPDGQPHQWLFNDHTLEIRLYNEGSRIDLNGATDIVLSALLKAVGVEAAKTEGLANAILDWRDPDEDTRLQGAESADYKAAGRPYGSKNAPFTSVAELRLILGFDPQLVGVLTDALTVYGNGGSVLQDYASPLVLTALGVTDSPLPPMPGQTRNIGGPNYRIQVRDLNGGPLQETIFRLGGRNGAPVTIMERH